MTLNHIEQKAEKKGEVTIKFYASGQTFVKFMLQEMTRQDEANYPP